MSAPEPGENEGCGAEFAAIVGLLVLFLVTGGAWWWELRS